MPRAFARSVGVAAYWPFHTKREHDRARRLAGQAIRNALKRGDLLRQPCERCLAGDGATRGRRGVVEAHHDDYAQPLQVRWLCRRHHQAVHREIGSRLPTPEQFTDIRLRENRSILNSCDAVAPLVLAVTTDLLAEMGRKGITQMALAKSLGVSRQQVNLYFNGGIRTMKVLASIAAACGLSVSISLHPPNDALQKASGF